MKGFLTPSQNKVYVFFRDYVQKEGRSPTVEEMRRYLGVASTNAVHKQLMALVAKGYLYHNPNATRGLQLADPADGYLQAEPVPSIPILDRVHADRPDRLFARSSGSLYVDPRLLERATNRDACWIGKVGDDGLGPDGVRQGDYVVFERFDLDDLRNGQAVVLLRGEQVLVRRLLYKNQRHILNASLRGYPDLSLGPNDLDRDFVVLGLVLAIIRRVL